MTKIIIGIAGIAAIAYAAAGRSRGDIEQADGEMLPIFSIEALTDTAETIMNKVTEQSANVEPNTATQNEQAFLAVLREAEGTARAVNPYGVCYGYTHEIANFADHPAVTGEWTGNVLPDAMCKNAGFGAGCKSTAAGAYQIIKPTWKNLKAKLGLPNFEAAAQDMAALELVRSRGALEDVRAGRFELAVGKCKNEWASLPGNYAKQGQRSTATLTAWFTTNGGKLA